MGTATLAALALRSHLAATNLAMLYLLGVIVVAARCDWWMAVAASLLSVAAFDLLCVPPYYTFRISDWEYLVTFAVMLAVALIISSRTEQLRTLAADASARAARIEALYRLSRGLAGGTRVFEMARTAADLAKEVFGFPVTIFLPQQGKILFERRTSLTLPVPVDEQEFAQRAFETNGRTKTDKALYLPLRVRNEAVGVMCVVAVGSLSGEQQHLLEVFADQTALAIDRAMSERVAEDSRLRMQSEQMRSSLLSAVSHDLRTPLSTITGAASTLRLQGDRLDEATRQGLVESISDEAERLGRLVANLLDMTRLETGVELRRELYPLEEIVGPVLQRLDARLAGRRVTVDLPENTPMVLADDVLAGQLLLNLMENALKHTPEGTPIDLVSSVEEKWVVLDVMDRGPGVAEGDREHIFEKFYRGRNAPSQGAGLGLAICWAIAQAHQGEIGFRPREGGGSVFRVRLPRGQKA
jgi:two-component system sensor histidine kinase KdpD